MLQFPNTVGRGEDSELWPLATITKTCDPPPHCNRGDVMQYFSIGLLIMYIGVAALATL